MRWPLLLLTAALLLLQICLQSTAQSTTFQTTLAQTTVPVQPITTTQPAPAQTTTAAQPITTTQPAPAQTTTFAQPITTTQPAPAQTTTPAQPITTTQPATVQTTTATQTMLASTTNPLMSSTVSATTSALATSMMATTTPVIDPGYTSNVDYNSVNMFPSPSNVQKFSTPGVVNQFNLGYGSQYGFYLNATDTGATAIDIDFSTFAVQYSYSCWSDFLSVIYVETDLSCGSIQNNEPTWTAVLSTTQLCGPSYQDNKIHNSYDQVVDLGDNTIRVYSQQVMVTVQSYSYSNGIQFSWALSNDLPGSDCSQHGMLVSKNPSPFFDTGIIFPPPPVQTFSQMSGSVSYMNYPNNDATAWLLQIPSDSGFANPEIKVIFNDTFDVDYSSGCSADFVQLIYLSNCTYSNGQWSLLTQNFCGTGGSMYNTWGYYTYPSDRAWTSTGGRDVMVVFRSDSISTAGGFVFYWEVVETGTEACPTTGTQDPGTVTTGPTCTPLTDSENAILEVTPDNALSEIGSISSGSTTTGSTRIWKIPAPLSTDGSSYSATVKITSLDVPTQSNDGTNGVCPGDQYAIIGYIDYTGGFCSVSGRLCGSTGLSNAYQDSDGNSYDTSTSWSVPASNIVVKWSTNLYSSGISFDYSFDAASSYPSGRYLHAVTGTSMSIDFSHDSFPRLTRNDIFKAGAQVAWVLTPPDKFKSNPVYRLRIKQMWTDTSYGMYGDGTMYQACYSFVSNFHIYQYKQPNSPYFSSDYRLCGQPDQSNGDEYYNELGVYYNGIFHLGDAHISEMSSPQFMIVYEQNQYSSVNSSIIATLDLVLPGITSLGNLSYPIVVPLGGTISFPMPINLFQNCYGCASTPTSWNVSIPTQASLPKWMSLITDTNGGVPVLSIFPNITQAPTTITVKFSACNEYDLCDSAYGQVKLVRLAIPDRTSTLSCPSRSLYVEPTGNPTKMNCTFLPKKQGSIVTVADTELNIGLSGSGYISDTFTDTQSSFGDKFTISYVAASNGGFATISEQKTNTSFDFMVFKHPDSTTTLTCKPVVVLPNQNITCTITPRNIKNLVLFENVFSGGNSSYFSLSGGMGAPLGVSLSNPTPVRGSSFTIQIRNGFAFPGKYDIYANLISSQHPFVSTSPASVYVVDVPDTTSTMTCFNDLTYTDTANAVPSNKSIICAVTAKKASGSITASASDFQIRLGHGSPAIVTVQNATIPAGDRIPFQINALANVNGTVQLNLYVRGAVANPPVSLNVVALPAYTKLSCDSPIVAGSSSTCTIKPRSSSGKSISVLGASFTLTKDTTRGSLNTLQPISGGGLYTLSDQFTFKFDTGTTPPVPSSIITIKDGFSGVIGGTPAATVAVYDIPDQTSLIDCGNGAVSRGRKITCYITPRRYVAGVAKEIVAAAGAFTAKSTIGVVSGVTIADGNVGAGKKFSFVFTAVDKISLSPLSTGTLNVSVTFNDNPSLPPVTATVSVIDSSAASSVFSCNSTSSFTASSIQLCSIIPYDSLQRRIYANATDFTPSLDPDPVTKESTSMATIGTVSPASGNIFYFTITPLKAWQPMTIRVLGTTGSVSLTTRPAVSTFSWYTGEVTDPVKYTIARDITTTSSSVPGALYAALSQELMSSMACSTEYCAAVTAGGRLVTWGVTTDSDSSYYLGRDRAGSSAIDAPLGLSGMSFQSVGALTDIMSYWDSGTMTSFFALSSNGVLYSWGYNISAESFTSPAIDGASASLKCGSSLTRVTAISGVGPVLLFSTPCAVYSITIIDLLPNGRSGVPNVFDQVAFTDPSPDFTLGVVQLMTSYYYGIILLKGNQFYTYGSGLAQTGMPSSDTTAAKYTFPPDVLPDGVSVTHVEGNTDLIVIQTSNDKLWMMSLVASYDPSGELIPNSWQQLDYDFLNQNAYDSHIQSISLSPHLGDNPGSLIIALSSGQVYNFDPLSGSPTTVSQTTATTGMAAKFVYNSVYNNFISMAPQIVIVDSSLDQSANAACGTSRVCASLDVALTKFTKPGTIFQLQNGTYRLSSTASITAADVKIESVTLNPAYTTIACSSNNFNGTCLLVTGKTFSIRGITVTGANNPSGKGGAMSISGNSYATIQDCIFINNRAAEGSAIHLRTGSSSAYIQNSVFSTNRASQYGGAINAAKGSQLLISSTKFTANTADVDGGAMRLVSATVTVSSTNFSRNVASGSGGAISASSSSSISGTSISLSRNVAISNGGAIDISESDVSFNSSTVSRNTAGGLGGAFNVQFGSLVLNSSVASGNTAGTLGGLAYCITIRNVQLLSSVASGNSAGSGGGVFYATFCSPTVMDSTLTNNSAPIGGAAYIASDASSVFVRSTFSSNRATDSLDGGGGAISFRNALTANITSVVFSGNTAQVRGGAVEFLGSRYTYQLSNLNATWNAAPSGGILYFDQMPPPLTPWKFGVGNYGKQGMYHASLPMALVWTVKLPSSYNASSAVPFSVNIGVRLIDYYNQSIAVDNSTTVTLVGADGVTAIVGKAEGILKEGAFNWTKNTVGAQLTPDSVGRVLVSSFVTNVGSMATSVIPVSFRRCEAGEFIENDVKCTMCHAGSFSTEPSSSTCTLCLAGQFQNATGQTGCYDCAPGSFSQSRGQSECTLAQPGFYQPQAGQSNPLVCWTNTVTNDTLVAQTTCFCKKNYIRDDNSDYDANGANTAENQPYICVDCPEGGNCDSVPGTTFATVLPKDSYQAEASGYNRSFVKCLNADQCVYGYPFGTCKNPVFTGHLCTTCAPGYGRNGEFGCSQCPSPTANRLYLTAAVFVGVILITFMVVSAMQASAQPKAVHSILIKIITSSIQFNSLALSFDYKWPAEVDAGLQTQKKMTSVGQSILSVDCFMSDASTTSPFYIQSLLFLLLPLMIAIGPVFFIAPIALFKKFFRGSSNVLAAAKDQYITSVVVGLFVVHPNIVQQALKMFNCKSLASQPDYNYLVADLRERCWHDDHKKWAFAVGLPMILFWVIGIPVAALFMLRKNRDQLDTQKMKMRYGFLSQGYTSNSYFWEIVVLGRKIVLSAIAVFLASEVTIQSLCALTLCVLALVGHTYYHPFDNPLLDYVEFLSLCNSFVTFMCGQYLFADIGDAGSSTISVIIILSNIAFFGYAARVLLQTIVKMQKEKKAAVEAKKGGAGDKAAVRPQPQTTAGAALFVQDASGKMVPLNVQQPMAMNGVPMVASAYPNAGNATPNPDAAKPST